jgi:hypothetical protein
MTANRVCWVSRSALVVMVSHFPKLDADLEVLGSRCNMGLIEDKVNALWCHTPFRERGNEASIRVPRMFKSHI